MGINLGGQREGQTGVCERRWPIFCLGAVGLCVIGMQPLLFGALIRDTSLTLPDLAVALTLEIVLAGLSSLYSGFWRRHIRAKTVVLLLLLTVMDLMSAGTGSAFMYTLVRALAGIAEGGLLALATAVIVQSPMPQRTGGHFVLMQSGLQGLLALLLALFVVPFGGTASAFIVLSALTLSSVWLVPLLPQSLGVWADADQGGDKTVATGTPGQSALTLGHIFFFFLFIGAAWGFIEPMGVQNRVSPDEIWRVSAMGLAVQLVGAVAATWFAGPQKLYPVIAIATLAGLLACWLLFLKSDLLLFSVAVLIVSFLWRFIMPFQIGLTASVDPSRRTVLLVPAAQLIGAALGPIAASVFASGKDASMVPLFGAGCLILSLSLLGFCRQAMTTDGLAAGARGDGKDLWRNWSGSVRANPQAIARPATLEELKETICNTPGPVRIAGSGHSFTPLAASAGTIIDMREFSGFISHDAATLQATFGAATKLGLLTPALRRAGQGLPNMGDIDKQSFAGALGTATHGTGLSLGAFHTQVERMSLVDGRGTLRTIDRLQQPDLLHATGVTLGLFGALTEVTIQNVPTYNLRRRRRIVPLEQILFEFDGFMRGHRSAEFFFVPFSGQVMLSTCDLTTDAPTERPTEDDEAALTILKRLRTTLGWAPWVRRKLIGSALRDIPPEDFVQEWQNVYTSERITRFNEMEYHLPFEAGAAALRDVITLSESRFPEVYFPFEVRSVAADDFWLSPFYRRPTCSIAIHHDATEDPTAFMREAEAIFRRYDGRPHWGKMHNLTHREISGLYPRFDDAMAVRREFDPKNRFITPYMASLFGIAA